VRTFIAIELPAEVREDLGALVERLRASGARLTWVRPEAMHLTLRFLGDVEPEPLERLREILAEAYAAQSRFELSVRGLGAFPNIRRPSVLWAGVASSDDALARVQQAAERAAQAIGLPPETKAFHPHLTLARVKVASEASKVLPEWEREQGYDAGTFPAEGVTLFSSTLTPRGAVYRPIQEYSFR
jgi:2'-5' RNA ligase